METVVLELQSIQYLLLDIYLSIVRSEEIYQADGSMVLCVVRKRSLEEVELTNNRPEQFTIIYLFIDRLNKSGV